ncbi:MAG: GGDEF domain-containing protein [Butyrivibrio sp.]
MINAGGLYDLSAAAVRNACREYCLNGSTEAFTDKKYNDNTSIIGLDSLKKIGQYRIESEEYTADVYNDDVCTVTACLTLSNSRKYLGYNGNMYVTVSCVMTEDGIRFTAVHISVSNSNNCASETDYCTEPYYKKLLESLCDLTMELKPDLSGLDFDRDRYFRLFHENVEFNSIDEWFWHLCNNRVLEQDLEKLDLFRESDMEKRFKNNDFIVETVFRVKRDADEIIWIKMVFVIIPDATNTSVNTSFIMLKECTVEMNEKMRNLEFARTDPLTRIWNRRYTEELIEDRIKTLGNGIFILVDIDEFKNINDSYGHITGDDLLVRITSSISAKLHENDVFGRIGGDEFVIFLESLGNEEDDRHRIESVLAAGRFSYCENDIETDIHCSAGAVFFESREENFTGLYERADKVMYEAKNAGRDTYRVGR